MIHHSATDDGSPEAYARYHVQTRGWPGIGYHFVIQKDGGIYQTNRLDTISYHVSGQNTNSIGICGTGKWAAFTGAQWVGKTDVNIGPNASVYSFAPK